MSDGQRYTKAVNLQGFWVPVMSATWKSGPTFSDRSLSLKTIIQRGGKWRNGATRTEKCCTASGWSQKNLSCPYGSPNNLICFRPKTVRLQFLFNPARPIQCAGGRGVRCFLPLTINHPEQYSPLRAMFNVYSKPSLSVVLSQEPRTDVTDQSRNAAVVWRKCMWGENTWKWRIGMRVCVCVCTLGILI